MVQKLIQENADITLGYWGIRGLGQPIRFLLICANVPFSEYRFGLLQDGTQLNKVREGEDWQSVRPTLNISFPNLPYLIHTQGGSTVCLSQSNAILRYLARCFDFYGDSETDRIDIDVLQDEAYDFRNEIIEVAYTLGENYDSVFDHFSADTLPRYLDKFESYLSGRDNKTFFVGNRLSLVDFIYYELFWQMTLMVPNSITETNRPTLFNFIKIFEQDAGIASYVKSKNYIKRPINSPWASFA